VHGCEAALLGACWVVCIERCPWGCVGIGMDVFLFEPEGCVCVCHERVMIMCAYIHSLWSRRYMELINRCGLGWEF